LIPPWLPKTCPGVPNLMISGRQPTALLTPAGILTYGVSACSWIRRQWHSRLNERIRGRR
jgi:hypothetical protein